ncbi:MAG TPA: SRPBCC domain-containing protein [Actinomycetes bacterium]|jgi:uncharacterized protein YndB with AHSA1/START domain|nr:SRPBCC domain-containing protein [Actinomycetes bacterium]
MREPDLVIERHIAASPATVFSFFASPERWLRWQGVEAVVEPWPGGRFRMNVRGDGFASGRFTEVVPGRRLVFTWGWEAPERGVPPGSTTVEIDLLPDGDGTALRLVHRGLPEPEVEIHRWGWGHYSRRLAEVAAGGDPGPDPALAAT